MTGHALRRADWLALHDALARILDAFQPLPAEPVPLLDAVGRVLAEPVVSPIDQPPWDNSAMDGFAARTADIRGAGPQSPVELLVVDDVPAGGFPSRAIGPGEAARIMTGAPVPEGADTVVRVEHTDVWDAAARAGGGEGVQMRGGGGARPHDGDDRPRTAGWGGAPGSRIRILEDGDAARNIRRRGEDLRVGEVVLEPGHVLRPGEIGLLAAVGRRDVDVHRRPRVAILATGDELVGVDRFDEVRAGRKIVDSNSQSLAAAVRMAGGEPLLLGIARDDEPDLRARLEAATGADLILVTGGASVGQHDLVKDVLDTMGYVPAFWRVRMKPGSPVSFGTLRGVPIFGLPGNPVSVVVTFEVLVRPAIRRMLGRRTVHPATIRVRAGERLPGAGRLTHFPRVRLEPDGRGGSVARLAGAQGSGVLSSVARADALAIVPGGVAAIEPGETALAIPLGPCDPVDADLGFPPGTL